MEKTKNRLEISNSEINEVREELSEYLHESWKEGIEIYYENNNMSPNSERLRPSKDKTGLIDQEWFKQQELNGAVFPVDDNGNKLVNTNVHYSDLPPSWQNANIEAASFVSKEVASDYNQGLDITKDAYIEEFASKIHDNWMKDNSWQQEINPELFVPYQELPEIEKAKDRNQVLLTIEKMLKL